MFVGIIWRGNIQYTYSLKKKLKENTWTAFWNKLLLLEIVWANVSRSVVSFFCCKTRTERGIEKFDCKPLQSSEMIQED